MSGYEPTYERLASFENLYRAAARARKGKRFKQAASTFERHLAENLTRLRVELLEQTYRPGRYRTFLLFEPAKRFISAAPYRDRVVHHALCNVVEPLFERCFIFDSYANRVGKGTHRALARCKHYTQRFRYVLQCDVRLFFPSIDHEILVSLLGRRIHDDRVLHLVKLIVNHSNEQPQADFYFPGDDLFTPFERRKGLPIGNLTSQLWANVYLDPLDHFFKDDLGAPAYIRYVDDFLLFSSDKQQLAEWREAALSKLAELRLLLHEKKSKIYPVREGIPFLGFRVFPTHRRLLPKAVKLARRRLTRLAAAYERGQVSADAVERSIQAWVAHARHGNTQGLRRSLLGSVAFRAGGRHRAAGRLVEQQP